MADLGLPQVSTPPISYDLYRFSPEFIHEKPIEEPTHRENLDELVTEAVHLLTGQKPKSPSPSAIPEFASFLGLSEKKKSLSPSLSSSEEVLPSLKNVGFLPGSGEESSSQKNTCYAQLSMLLFWSPTLETLPNSIKDMIWSICLCVPSFNNYQKNSFRQTVFSWMTNPESNRVSILVLFSAVGYLIHHEVLQNIFFYPNTKTPVFVSQVPEGKKRNREQDNVIISPSSPSSPSSPKPQKSVDLSCVFIENVKKLQSSLSSASPQSSSNMELRPILTAKRSRTKENSLQLPPILPPIPVELPSIEPSRCRESLPSLKRLKGVMDVSSLIC